MKKIYTSPEAKLMSFISAERLATTADIDFDDLLNVSGSKDSVTPSANDIDLPLTGNV